MTKTYARTLTEADKEALANGIITDMSVDSYMMWSENKLMYARVRIADSSGALIAEDEESCSGEEAGAGNGISQTRTIPITDDIRQKLLATDSITVTHVFMYYTDNGFGFSVQKLESGTGPSATTKRRQWSLSLYRTGRIIPVRPCRLR